MIKRILIGLGGTPFTDVAIERAIELAKRHQAFITGVTVVDVERLKKVGPIPLGGEAYAQRLRDNRIQITEERIEESIAKFSRECHAANIECRIGREAGDPFELMISHARYSDVIIFGLKSLFDCCGFIDEPRDALIRLVSHGVRPIIAVSPEFRSIHNVLIAYSGSMESAKSMRRYVQLNPWPEVSLRIVHFGGDKDDAAQLLKDAEDYCRAHGFITETEAVAGSAKDHLLEYARNNNCDLIVMGNSIRNLIFRHLLGDTLLHTIQQADRPLFLSQ